MITGISIHALREEGDIQGIQNSVACDKFLSTPSARRATFRYRVEISLRSYFYPRPPRGGRRPLRRVPVPAVLISIHALREEGDFITCRVHSAHCSISIHALREEGDAGVLPLYGFSPAISIHALREEGDRRRVSVDFVRKQFLSTPSARRATSDYLRRQEPRRISIHALREEGDPPSRPPQRPPRRFLSTPSARRATSGSRPDTVQR